MTKTLYLAGGLFNAAEQTHNILLTEELSSYGYPVILPQQRAILFLSMSTGNLDQQAIVTDCENHCKSPHILVVANGDGPDADSGTGFEVGLAMATTGRAIVYRTDFRTAEDRELGINAMLCAKGIRYLYVPADITNTFQINYYYKTLASRIHEEILELDREE